MINGFFFSVICEKQHPSNDFLLSTSYDFSKPFSFSVTRIHTTAEFYFTVKLRARRVYDAIESSTDESSNAETN